jgi:hypothetical protein
LSYLRENAFQAGRGRMDDGIGFDAGEKGACVFLDLQAQLFGGLQEPAQVFSDDLKVDIDRPDNLKAFFIKQRLDDFATHDAATVYNDFNFLHEYRLLNKKEF